MCITLICPFQILDKISLFVTFHFLKFLLTFFFYIYIFSYLVLTFFFSFTLIHIYFNIFLKYYNIMLYIYERERWTNLHLILFTISFYIFPILFLVMSLTIEVVTYKIMCFVRVWVCMHDLITIYMKTFNYNKTMDICLIRRHVLGLDITI